MNWYLGQYFASALDCTVCNSWIWKKKGAKPHEYIKKPILQEIQAKKEIPEEKRIEMENYKLAMSLRIMQANFELNHPKKKEE